MSDTIERQKILLIDDADVFLYTLISILKDNYETLIAKNGKEGLETARAVMPDLIVLDVMMPGMSGYEVLEALKADEVLKSIPVVLLSGKDSDESREQGYALGAIDYIKKPFVRADVKGRIDTIMKSIPGSNTSM